MKAFIWIFIGGGLGSCLRYSIQQLLKKPKYAVPNRYIMCECPGLLFDWGFCRYPRKMGGI